MAASAGRLAAAVAFLAAAGLLLEFQTYTAGLSGIRLVWRIVDFFSFFTVDANLLVALVAGAAALSSESRAARWLTRPAVTAAACLYVVVAGATYFLILRYRHHPAGLALVADYLVHYIVPAAFVALWLGTLPKGGLTRRAMGAWMVFPSVYLAYALSRGPKTGFSPYPFFDVAELGYGGVALNVTALGAAFAGGAMLLAALDQTLSAARGRRVPVA